MDLIAAYTVRFSEQAKKELDDIYHYLAVEKTSGLVAHTLVSRIRKKSLSLKYMPGSFAEYEPHPGWHIIHVKNYRILYRIDEESKTVVITRILHSSQNY